MASITINRLMVTRDGKGLPSGRIVAQYSDGVTEEFPDLAAMKERIGDIDSVETARRLALYAALNAAKTDVDPKAVEARAVTFDAKTTVAAAEVR